MTVLQAVVLGVVQGLTEFLPISSSAHLVLIPEVLGWEKPNLAFIVLLHGATLISLLLYFRKDLATTARGFIGRPMERRFVLFLILGTIPAAIIGAVFESRFEEQFAHPFQVALQLVATGVLLIGAEALARRNDRKGGRSKGLEIEDLTARLSWGKSLGIGFGQALAIVPGISRSGATIGAGLAGGLNRAQAARFSFILSIPILAGTSLKEIPELAGAEMSVVSLIAGFAASLISGYVAIAGTIGYLQKRGLGPFAAYCLIVGSALALIISKTG